MASAHCSTKRWGQKHRDEKETAQEQVKTLQSKVDSLQAQVDVLTPRKKFWDSVPVIAQAQA
jgi:N-dimethylarginine dimethylaminohydrolase